MIQRIQSIYLLLAAILMAVTACSPLLVVNATQELTPMGITDAGVLIKPTWGIVATAGLSALLSFVAIFFFKKRKKQASIVNGTIFAILFFYATTLIYMLSYYDNFFSKDIAIAFGILLPVLAIVFLLLGKSKIKKDEKLVQSLNRIR